MAARMADRFLSVSRQFRAILPLNCEKRFCDTTQCYGWLHYFCILQSQFSTFWRVFLSLAGVLYQKISQKILQLYQECTIIIVHPPVSTTATRECFHMFVRSFSIIWQQKQRSFWAGFTKGVRSVRCVRVSRVHSTWVFITASKPPI